LVTPGLLGEDQLRVAGDARRELARQRDRLVERVGVQALRAAEHRGIASTVVRTMLLYGSCSVSDTPDVWQCGAQHRRARLLRVELADDARPRGARGAQLRDLHEEVHADGEEERERPANSSMVEPRSSAARTYSRPSAIVNASSCTASRPPLHVVAGDRDRVELRHVRAVYSMMSATIRMLGSGG
jgi:hypothetical protein